jgi:diguanylate cyclase (GGDEF)-like protein
MQKIAVLYDASQAVLSTFELDEVLNYILAIARDYFHLQTVAILLVEPGTDRLEVRSHIGAAACESHHHKTGEGIIGNAARLKRPLCVPDVSKDSRYIPCVPTTRSELAIPLMVRDQVVGVLNCESEKENFFDPENVDLLTLFSTQASMALENARLYTLEQKRTAQLEAINAIAKKATAVLDLNDLLAKVCVLVRQTFKSEQVSIMMKEDSNLVLSAFDGSLTLAIAEDERIPVAKCLAGQAIDTNKTVFENDVKKSSRYVPIFTESFSRMCIPLVSFEKALGVLALDSSKAMSFHESDVQPLESVADICVTAIQNAQHVDRVRQLAYIDGLTGIFNRRFFEMRIAEEMERARRYDGSLAVIMIDIDNFKKLNDEFGHLLGDEVLRQVSSVFSLQLRRIDVVCRYGGEEFAMLLPQTTAEQALSVAEKLRREVADWQFPGVPRAVTISAGTAAYPAQGSTRDELVRAADAALYAAKQQGRNRVCAAPMVTDAPVSPAPSFSEPVI